MDKLREVREYMYEVYSNIANGKMNTGDEYARGVLATINDIDRIMKNYD